MTTILSPDNIQRDDHRGTESDEIGVTDKHALQIAIAGRSMVEKTEMARELGYLDIPSSRERRRVKLKERERYPTSSTKRPDATLW